MFMECSSIELFIFQLQVLHSVVQPTRLMFRSLLYFMLMALVLIYTLRSVRLNIIDCRLIDLSYYKIWPIKSIHVLFILFFFPIDSNTETKTPTT